MKTLPFLLLLILIIGCSKDPVVDGDTGTFKDSRDSKVYKWVTIGTQSWMAENLAYLPAISSSTSGSETEKLYHVYGYKGNSIADARESVNYKTYGVLYNWPAAMNEESGSSDNPSGVQGACPAGWHLPGDAEWTLLTDYLGPTAGSKMKTTTGWENGNGTNITFLSVLPGGYRNLNGSFTFQGRSATLWSASEDGADNALIRTLDDYFDGIIRESRSKRYGFSVRCVRN